MAGPSRPGILLGLAIANKEWALLAVGPVLLALPSRRVLMLLCAGAAATLVLAPARYSSAEAASSTGAGASAAPTSAIFLPMQVFWFLGRIGGPGLACSKRSSTVSHPLMHRSLATR